MSDRARNRKNRAAPISELVDRVRKLPWTAQFWKTLDNPTASGGKIDMYILIDDDTGESLVSLGVPHGEGALAEYVAFCCADPWFVRVRGPHDTELPRLFNRAIETFSKGEEVDAREVFIAAMTMIEGYVGQLPSRSRAELIDSCMGQLSALRRQP